MDVCAICVYDVKGGLGYYFGSGGLQEFDSGGEMTGVLVFPVQTVHLGIEDS